MYFKVLNNNCYLGWYCRMQICTLFASSFFANLLMIIFKHDEVDTILPHLQSSKVAFFNQVNKIQPRRLGLFFFCKSGTIVVSSPSSFLTCAHQLGFFSHHSIKMHVTMCHLHIIMVRDAAAPPHTRLTSTKRFTNLKVDLTVEQVQTCNLFLHISYEFEYFYQCITTFWGLRDY